MSRSVLVGLLALAITLAAVGAGVPAFAVTAGVDGTSGSTGSPQQQPALGGVDSGQDDALFSALQEEFDTTTFRITVHDDGTATWTFRYERRLDSQSEESEFESFAEEFRNAETELYTRFTEQATALTQTGTEQTDREMAATSFNRTAGIEYQLNTLGVVEMTFVWENFAPVDDDGTVTVGDVFEGGMYIGPDQTLVVQAGDGLVFDTVRPEAQYTGSSIETADSISWSGEREFLDGRPYVVLIPESAAGDDDGTDGETGADGTDDPGSDGDETGMSSSWLVAIGVLALLGVGATAAWYRSDRDGGTTVESTSDPSQGHEVDGAIGAPPESESAGAIADEELMTDEDRVVSLIRENGGRMKQVNIVEETGWSKSKVSMLLSDMEDEGIISKLRVGRENIISLEGFEPEATKSPFEE